MQEAADLSLWSLDVLNGLGGLPSLMVGPLDDASNLIYYREIHGLLRDALEDFGANLFARVMSWVGMVALTLLTLWIMIQGYRIITGQSRDSMMAMVVNSTKAVVIVGIATGMAIGGSTLYELITDDLSAEIASLITGDDGDLYEGIDRSLGFMQLALSSIDAVQTGGSQLIQDSKTRNMWFTGVGTAGPAIVAGTMLLFYKAMMAFLVGLGPICVLALMFEKTKALFDKWLYFCIGTLVALAALSVMAGLSMDIVAAVSTSFWTGKLLSSNPEGINSLALQQGGLGLILTTLIVSVPPAIAAIFNGLMGQFGAYSAFGSLRGGADSAGRQPGVPGYQPQPSNAGRGDSDHGGMKLPSNAGINVTRSIQGSAPVQEQDVIRTGATLREGTKK